MPEKRTLERARRDREQGKAPSTQAGEFVREEMEHIREGKHGARSAKQAIAIGLSKARRSGIDLQPPGPGEASNSVRKRAAKDLARGHGADAKRQPSARRSRATKNALKRESGSAASPASLARQARSAARRRPATQRSAAATRAARTKGARGRATAARKAARTRHRSTRKAG
jgi:hypothetical protein